MASIHNYLGSARFLRKPVSFKDGKDANVGGAGLPRANTSGGNTNLEGIKQIIDANINQYTFFSVYSEVSARLGDLYSDCFAKMTGDDKMKKMALNDIYNSTLKDVVNEAIENVKPGQKLDFDALAQQVKIRVNQELQKCNYDAQTYYKNKIDEQINKSFNTFSD